MATSAVHGSECQPERAVSSKAPPRTRPAPAHPTHATQIHVLIGPHTGAVAPSTSNMPPATVAVCGLTTTVCGLTMTECGLTTSVCGLTATVCGLTTTVCGLTTTVSGLTTSECGLTTTVGGRNVLAGAPGGSAGRFGTPPAPEGSQGTAASHLGSEKQTGTSHRQGHACSELIAGQMLLRLRRASARSDRSWCHQWWQERFMHRSAL